MSEWSQPALLKPVWERELSEFAHYLDQQRTDSIMARSIAPQTGRSWLPRRAKVELFEQIRREFEFGVGTISGVSRKLGAHRRLVCEALNIAVPAESKPQRVGCGS